MSSHRDAPADGGAIVSQEWRHDGYTVSTDPARLDLEVVHGFLAASYWAEGIPRDTVERSIAH